MLIQRLIQSIRNIPGAILRLLRAVLLPIVLRASGTGTVVLQHRPNCPASPTSPRMECASSSTILLPSGPHVDPADNLSPSMPSVVYAPDTPPATQRVTPVRTLNIIPAAPEQIQRYLRRKPIEKKANERNIDAGKLDYSEKTPGVWKRIVHPEGARYFFNPHKQVFTDIDLTERNLVEINQCINFLREEENRVVPGSPFEETLTQLVIQLDEKDGNRKWLYYFSNHETRVVFWIDEFETTKLSAFDDLQSVTAVSHIGYAIEFQYWLHCEQYPSCDSVSQEHVTEFCGMIAHACADRGTSEAPLSTLSESQLANLLTLAPYLQSRVGVIDEYALWVIARVMGIFASMRFYNFYGQPGARLEADSSIYIGGENGDGRSVLFAPLDMFLFYMPSAHIKELKGIWVDNLINYARWEVLSRKLSSEWTGFTIYSTVMLVVDVSFLLVPGVDNGDVGSQSVPTIVIYMSLLSIGGSLLSSILLARRWRAQDHSAAGAALFMYSMTQWGGFKALGIMHSLPFALLTWAYVLDVILRERSRLTGLQVDSLPIGIILRHFRIE
ncbi:hypothetical protein J3R82DRAFT_3270 [Butyriboletus roseoflavus]|nr:hypothetical protein J3R82DRAFT_3270 [Butyriboletus roseoflavus]